MCEILNIDVPVVLVLPHSTQRLGFPSLSLQIRFMCGVSIHFSMEKHTSALNGVVFEVPSQILRTSSTTSRHSNNGPDSNCKLSCLILAQLSVHSQKMGFT